MPLVLAPSYMKTVHIVSLILLVVGGLNWGLVGIADYNLVEALLGAWPSLLQIVYVLVGLAALVEIFAHKKSCKSCGAPGGGTA